MARIVAAGSLSNPATIAIHRRGSTPFRDPDPPVAVARVLASNSPVTHSARHRMLRRTVFVLAALLLLRATIPVGYMPGNLLDGEYVRLCPVGLPSTFASHHEGHDGHEESSGTEASCPLGLLLSAVAIHGTAAIGENIEPQSLRPVAPAVLSVQRKPFRVVRARAPPVDIA